VGGQRMVLPRFVLGTLTIVILLFCLPVLFLPSIFLRISV
jgi:hypothetical protein